MIFSNCSFQLVRDGRCPIGECSCSVGQYIGLAPTNLVFEGHYQETVRWTSARGERACQRPSEADDPVLSTQSSRNTVATAIPRAARNVVRLTHRWIRCSGEPDPSNVRCVVVGSRQALRGDTPRVVACLHAPRFLGHFGRRRWWKQVLPADVAAQSRCDRWKRRTARCWVFGTISSS